MSIPLCDSQRSRTRLPVGRADRWKLYAAGYALPTITLLPAVGAAVWFGFHAAIQDLSASCPALQPFHNMGTTWSDSRTVATGYLPQAGTQSMADLICPLTTPWFSMVFAAFAGLSLLVWYGLVMSRNGRWIRSVKAQMPLRKISFIDSDERELLKLSLLLTVVTIGMSLEIFAR